MTNSAVAEASSRLENARQCVRKEPRDDFGGPRLAEVQLNRASLRRRKACIVALATFLGMGACAHAETIATFTRNPANPVLRGMDLGSADRGDRGPGVLSRALLHAVTSLGLALPERRKATRRME